MSTIRLGSLTVIPHRFSVPLSYDHPRGHQINIFAREVVATERINDELPYLVYLHGGPGHAAPRPISRSGWLGFAVDHYRVLLLDQRGTGLSSPIGRNVARNRTDSELAEYLTNFRADSIVADAELIRTHLAGDQPWAILGQSYGGFCALTYLSKAPNGLREVYITGGLPGLDSRLDDIYRATYRRVRERNRQYFDRYPEDLEIVSRIADILRNAEIRLADQSLLTIDRFQQLGVLFGYSYGFEEVHYLLEGALDEYGEFSDTYLAGVYQILSYACHPLYAVLQEPIYAQGESTRWAAARVAAEFPEFSPNRPVPLFTGEMMYPEMFELDPAIAPFGEAANILAYRSDWPHLYDVEALKNCSVPIAACIYVDDMYVEREFSEETARVIPSLRAWITNEFMHDGLRSSGEQVLGRLFGMIRGSI